MQNAHQLNEILRLFILESLHSRSIPIRKPKNGNMILEIRKNDGFIKKIVLKESYIIGVLGIKKKRLMESLDDPKFQRHVLREHLLFEGWWDAAKQFVGDSIDNIVDKASEATDILKNYGQNAKGVVAALWAAVQDEKSLNDLRGGAISLASKRIAEINKAIAKIESRLKELDCDDLDRKSVV